MWITLSIVYVQHNYSIQLQAAHLLPILQIHGNHRRSACSGRCNWLLSAGVANLSQLPVEVPQPPGSLPIECASLGSKGAEVVLSHPAVRKNTEEGGVSTLKKHPRLHHTLGRTANCCKYRKQAQNSGADNAWFLGKRLCWTVLKAGNVNSQAL